MEQKRLLMLKMTVKHHIMLQTSYNWADSLG